ncbi:trypsin alpha-3-like [Physella acuta]|uniref:trypsin alpha-3-like n=1 Tax=Physella acuta TaxID=109671 RepID=UPI0027DDF611|nr:trypsin alpha-3-like [Physella acuta]
MGPLVVSLLLLATVSALPPRINDLLRETRSRYDKIDAPGCGQRPLIVGNGASELTTRIVGGRESVPYSWPSICSLRLSASPNDHICGSTLVKSLDEEYYLITAASCITDQRASRYTAHCGIHDRAASTEPHRVIITFFTLAVHSQYNEWTLDYDIAIFKVATPLPTNNYISAVCIPNEGWNDMEPAIVAGWGSLNEGGISPYKLHQVNKPIKPRSVCEERYGAASITMRMLCAGLPTGGVDACEGRHGGPLYTYREDRWTLTGIVSWGMGCGVAGKPGVYADVIELKNWIHSVINF